VTFGDKTKVNGVRIGPSLLEPEKEASILSEAYEIRVTILAFIVMKISDPERLESFLVKGVLARKIANGDNDVVEH